MKKVHKCVETKCVKFSVELMPIYYIHSTEDLWNIEEFLRKDMALCLYFA